ncbi:MAG: preprotein translocase subunit SecG [Lachnospiraceae bacterium]|nr:preprotein translocase subunit SecG [Lachnospiraceae bacterium]
MAGTVIRYILMSIFGLIGLILIVIIMLQEGKSAGLGTIGGMADSYWEKNRSRSAEGKLEKFTKFAAIAFFVLAFALAFNF